MAFGTSASPTNAGNSDVLAGTIAARTIPLNAGTCLAAGVFFVELFGRTPAGFSVEVPGVTAAEAQLLLGFSTAKT